MTASSDRGPIDASADGRTNSAGVALIVIAALLVAFALWAAKVVVIPLVLAALASYPLHPMHRRLVRLGVPNGLSALFVLVFALAAIAVGVLALRPQATAFLNNLPTATQRLRDLIAAAPQVKAGSAIAMVQQAAQDIKQAADEAAPASHGVVHVQVEEPLRLGDLVWRGSLGMLELLGQVTVIIVLVFYALAHGDAYKRKVMRIVGPSLSQKRTTVEVLNDISHQIERFLLARLCISVIVGVATGFAFRAMGVSQPAMWGLGAGVLNSIPYVGPCVVAGAAALMGLVQFGTLAMALLLAGVSAAIAAIEGAFITPWLIGRAGRMNTGVVFVSLTVWGTIWGFWGWLLAMPIMLVIKAIADHVEGGATIRELLSE